MMERNKMKIYMAARFSKRSEANRIGNLLKERGHTIVSRWSLPESDHVKKTGLSEMAEASERRRFAIEDLEDIKKCDCIVSIMEEPRSNGRGGRHVEFGYGLALDKIMIVIGPKETVFHNLEDIYYFESIEEFEKNLGKCP